MSASSWRSSWTVAWLFKFQLVLAPLFLWPIFDHLYDSEFSALFFIFALPISYSAILASLTRFGGSRSFPLLANVRRGCVFGVVYCLLWFSPKVVFDADLSSNLLDAFLFALFYIVFYAALGGIGGSIASLVIAAKFAANMRIGATPPSADSVDAENPV